MILRSLRLRLLLFAAIAITVALIVAGFGLTALFDRHVERRIQDELATYLRQLSGGIEFAPDGTFSLGVPMADPRFDRPFGGLYWQVEDDDHGLALHSRSLWDSRIGLPTDPLAVGVIHRHLLPGPDDTVLLVHERRIAFPAQDGARSLRMAVALDRSDLALARAAFAADLGPSLALLGFVLLVAVWFQVQMGLRPLDAIKRGVAAVRNGTAKHLPIDQPVEVKPLADEVNDLLAAQEQAVERAHQRAGDLAHGLKTPLTVLQADAGRLRNIGQDQIASEIEILIETMRRHVDQELTRSRLQNKDALRSKRSVLDEMVARVVRTIKRTPLGKGRQWHVEVPAGITVLIASDDLAELLGNLLDNAAKWAKAHIHVRVSDIKDGHIALYIEDDGPGVPEPGLTQLGRRGLRLDEQAPGNGLGLAIAREIITAYGGTIGFKTGAHGGLLVRINLPTLAKG